MRVVLAGIDLKNKANGFDYLMDETKNLCEACNYEVVGIITQSANSLDPKTAFRKGKVEECKTLVDEVEAELVIFHNALSIQCANRLANIFDVPVIDRTTLILQLFSLRARSKQAKLQTELARLEYDLPQALTDINEDESHERGGSAYNRGAGEMRSSIIERRYKKRISALKQELKKIQNQYNQDEKRRTKTLLKRVGLVGYTNAGKSSLMNLLLNKTSALGKEVFTKDMLFATLDTSVRSITMKGYQFLLYDTVGFVSDLPHGLIEAFQSTLDAARDADLLLHVIDISDPNWKEKEEITIKTLETIQAGDIPILRIFNKADLIDSKEASGIYISCLNKTGIEDLEDKLIEMLYPNEISRKCFIPYDKMALLHKYESLLSIEILESLDEGMKVLVQGEKKYVDVFDRYEIKER